ncbi:hypothetical protein EDB81DRAFT_382386 [Dactylonectria macrodidyma]|uniref:Uncharacterized protein n=1 Tax=Dactylonectria macrodidyma TaxID=307937 RepID=A0A9P9F9I2_9HYPO|nr:hypothetical protein EDB81DRAFT_382386 [Dactylonectria macrodidyma]
MNSLKVPEAGWQLEGPASNDSEVPQQAFALTLSDNVIEDMIKCVQNGDGLNLTLGSTPTFTYGSKSHVISPPTDSYPYDLYLTKPFDSTRRAVRLPLTGSLFKKPENNTLIKAAVKADKDADVRPKAGKTSKSSTPSGLDSDRENLQNELAALAAGREKARVVGKLPTTKKGAPKAKGKLLSGYSSTPRSMPTSPGHISLGSPSSTPTLSASQQHVERAKEQRVILVHELAVQDRSLEYLTKKWTGRKEDMRTTLEKVADNLPDTKKWAMKKTYWKELDVWNYDYDSQELRQKAIDNAVRQYDKQRLSASEPEWQKLLPKEERGKGKCLSKLQANLAKGPSQPPPKIKVQKADGSPSSRDETGSLDGDRPRTGAENMSRSISNPLPPKPKKISGQEAQVKRLLGNSKPKTPVTKTSPTKTRPTASKANGGRILSKEIIVNSDSSGDEAPAVVVKPKPAATTKTKDTVIAKPRPPIREPTKQQTTKRPRDDDDSSSSSGTPLSKRIKPKQPLPASRLKHRPSDASQNSRSTATTTSSHKSKNTSPAKSSPLASSPPTNASDLENEAPRAPPVTKKRKVEADVKQPAPKRAAISRLSEELVSKAQTFKVVYEKYETLHYEISALSNPPKERLGRLKDMRDRLKIMKMEIYQECPPNKV